MATSTASPVMQQQQTTTPNPMAQSGTMNGSPDTSSDDTEQDGDSNFIQEFSERLDTLPPDQLQQFTQLLQQADPNLLKIFISLFPEFVQALQQTATQQGGGSQGAEAAAQQGAPQGGAGQSQYPGTPMPSPATGLRGQFMQKSSPLS